MIYHVLLITTGLAWFFQSIGIFPRYLPRVIWLGIDLGFYGTHAAIFVIVWALIFLLERNIPALQPPMRDMRSRQGTVVWLDGTIAVAAFVLLLLAIAQGSLTRSFAVIAIVAMVGAGYSLLAGGETSARVRRQRDTLPVPTTPTVQDLPADPAVADGIGPDLEPSSVPPTDIVP